MKLRIKGNSIRLRLTQTEVDVLRDVGRVAERTVFGPERAFIYAVEAAADAPETAARLEDAAITVRIPRAQVMAWADSEQVSIEGSQTLGDGDILRLLVEKDFQCLHRRPTEEDADTFPHPLATDDAP